MPFAAKLTILVILSVTAGLIGYDIWAYLNSTPNHLDTLSGRMKLWGEKVPTVAYLFGALGGHFWGPWSAGYLLNMTLSTILFAGSALTFTLIGIWLGRVNPLLGFYLGSLVGMILWPQ